MSGNIRRQLGPTRKRLEDRIIEASTLIADDDFARLKGIRTKLASNMAYHSKLTAALTELVDVDEAEQVIIDKELEKCTVLEMTANEVYDAVNELVEEAVESRDGSAFKFQVHQHEKLQYEIDKLKVETEYKRVQLEKLKHDVDGDTKLHQRIKLPKLCLPTFTGTITDWSSFWDSFSSTIHRSNGLSKIDKYWK